MMKLRLSACFLALYFALVVGCCSATHDHTWHDLPTPNQIGDKNIVASCGNVDLLPYRDAWIREAARRYDNFILIMVHGEVIGGKLWAMADHGPPELIRDVIERMRNEYGKDRRVVLAVCNKEGLTIRIPKVTYAKDIVWAQPDSFESHKNNQKRDKEDDHIGDIFEFVENP